MDVKPVDNENPLALRVGIDGIFNMSRKIGFVSGWTDTRRQHTTRGDFKVGNQAQHPVTNILMFNLFNQSRFHRFGRCFSVQILDTTHLVDTVEVTFLLELFIGCGI